MLNLYIEDGEAINALTQDFANYLEFCRPLMHIYNTMSGEKLEKLCAKFVEADGDTILLRTVSAEQMREDGGLSDICRSINKIRTEIIKRLSFTEIITVSEGEASFSKEGQSAEIKDMALLEEANRNYTAVLSETAMRNIIVLAKESVGVLMISAKPPYCTFEFDEQNMVGAFWDYLNVVKRRAEFRSREKK